MNIKYDNLTIEERIGQRFIFGTNSENIDCIIELIKKCYIGGVILYKKNYTDYNDMLSVIKKIKLANKNNQIPLFIAIDQEGGKVNRLPSEIHRLKNIYDVSKKDVNLLKDHADVIGDILFESGINMDLAPVADIYNNSNSKAIYKRCFYGDYENVYKCVSLYVSRLKNKNIIPVVKHFPGHGSSNLDSHFVVPYVFNYKDVINRHMYPFKKLIDDDLDAMMIGHIVVRKLTNGLPASLSRNVVRKYLVNNYNYNGLIITDEINMLKRSLLYRNIYMKKVFNSLNDIILVKIKSFDEGYQILNKYRKCYCLDELNDFVKKILKIKEKYKITDQINQGCNIKNVNKIIDKINKEVE